MCVCDGYVRIGFGLLGRGLGGKGGEGEEREWTGVAEMLAGAEVLVSGKFVDWRMLGRSFKLSGFGSQDTGLHVGAMFPSVR